MPWEVVKRGGQYQVVTKATGRVVGTHGSRPKAEAQVRALYANVKDAGGKK